jgi:glycogen phosphorylase
MQTGQNDVARGDQLDLKQEWVTVYKEMTKEGIKSSFKDIREYRLDKDQYTATDYDNYLALALSVRDRIVERWIMTQQRYHKSNAKRVYYLSMEFLIGRLLGSNIVNLGIAQEVKAALDELGFDLEAIRQQEPDAGLGNGGLGRLAACFLDSMASMGIPAHGYGIRYEYGMFRQKIVNGYQVELPDEWLKFGNPWESPRPECTVKVQFYGKTNTYHDASGRSWIQWVNTEDILAVPYDMPVIGYKNEIVNTLRLWSSHAAEEFDMGHFNYGDYESAVYKKVLSENITKVLYPNDMVVRGKELRLKQEYLLVAATVADIIRRFKSENSDFLTLPDKISIQINDTHPSLAIVELMRILLDQEGLDWAPAWDITVRTFAYTNHTVMPEALETWPVYLFEIVLPRHLQIIYEINMRFLDEVSMKYPGDNDRLRRMSLIDDADGKKVRMAYLSIVGSHSVNGVSKLHTDLLKSDVFRDFYELSPDKFNNKTNGVTYRRWLLKANTHLSGLISQVIGDGWIKEPQELERLKPFKDDLSFCGQWRAAKAESKKMLAAYIHKTMGVNIDPGSLFDVQVKRIHEYKRQMMFCLYIIREYLRLKQDANADIVARTFIVSGKSAPGYFMAKLIIKLINNVAEVINKDKGIKDKIKLVFLENYRVSLAEKIFPASELSEQISTAGTEASGTGCMKFMCNGALTIGTYDGATIEMLDAAGAENIFMFGLHAEEISALRACGYNPRAYMEKYAPLEEAVRLIQSNFFSRQEQGIFDPLVHSLYNADPYFICADFEAYCVMQDIISSAYRNQELWTMKSIINVATSGIFSSDRTIAEYARDVWAVPLNKKP